MNKTNKILLFSKSDIKLSENIRTLRKNAGWSQEELGEKLGVTKQQIGVYERGGYPPMIMILNIIELFDLPKDEVGKLLYEKIPKGITPHRKVESTNLVSEPSGKEYRTVASIKSIQHYSFSEFSLEFDKMRRDIDELKKKMENRER